MSNSEYLKELIFPSTNKLSEAELTRLNKYTEEEVIKIVKDNNKSIDNLCKNFSKDELHAMYFAIVGAKPLSKWSSKYRVAESLRGYINSFDRTELLLSKVKILWCR